jgi:hypothetical protein
VAKLENYLYDNAIQSATARTSGGQVSRAVSRHGRKANGALLVNDCSTRKPGINFQQISRQHGRVSKIREADTFQPNVFLRFSEIGQT